MHHFADECSEHLHYVPERLKIITTRRKKYACRSCHGQIKRASICNRQPLAKSMASAGLLAYLIVSKFADGLPLYRIAARLQRLGVELSHALMSDWLVQCAQALFRIEREIAALSDAERYQERQRRAVPILHSFKCWLDTQAQAVLPKSGLGEAIGYALRNWEALCRYTEAGHLEASNNYAEQCMRTVAVGRKAFLFVGSERAGHAAAIYYSLVESCKVNKVNPLTYLTYVLTHVRDRSVILPTPDEFTAREVTQAH
jgi:hypothetical protein